MANLGLALSWLNWLAYAGWVCACGWAGFAALVLHGLLGRKALLPVHGVEPEATLQLVSVLLPARNEAHRILAQSVSSLLAQDYEQLEVIAVNDRSTDETDSILRSMEKRYERLRVIEGREPPAGWLGKSYALQQALELSRGSWILTVDADMVFEKEAVSTALGHALAKDYDVLTLMPGFVAASFWERVFTPAWLLSLLGAFPFVLTNHPKIKHAMAFGGFTLVRRAALARIGDFAAVRGEIVEDVRLAELLKESGARYHIEHAPNLVSTRMQNGLSEIWSFLSRGMFGGMRYSLILSALTLMSGVAFVVAPVFTAIFCGLMLAAGANVEWLKLLIPSLLIWVIQIFALYCICLKFEIPARYALTTPLGLSLFYAALLVSVINILRGKGVFWKERRVYGHEGVPVPARGFRRRN
jgi:cellulose synthase/poly-beta-1,6-N-acetylglucosamine synthase-like glycosyltransferase